MKRIALPVMLVVGISVSAQKTVKDSADIQNIEDVQLHKTGNPNKARIFTSKAGLTAMENPQQISIVTHEIIEAQQAKQLSDVVKNVNGVYLASSRGGSQDSFGARGFTFGNENIFKNGAKVNSGIFPEVSGLERVEVLKGGNAMLYGNVGPGGILNMVTKKPRFNFGGSVGFNTGSWDTYKPTVDFYGPLSKNVAFRVNGSYESAGSFRDQVNSTKHYFNPSFAFNIGENTQIIFEGDYLYQKFTPDFGIGSVTETKSGISTFNTNLPNNIFLGENWNYQTNQQATSDIIINHSFSKNWSLNSVISYQNYTKDYFSVERVQWNYDATSANQNPVWKRTLNKTYTEQNYGSAQVNLNGHVKTGIVLHKILIGADADFGNADSYTYVDNKNKVFGTNYTVGNWTLTNPDSWTHFAEPEAFTAGRTRITTKREGFYMQDLAEITSSFKILAGVRYSILRNDDTVVKNYLLNTETTTANSGTKDKAFSPKFGLIYSRNDNFMAYGTYTNSFVPNTGTDIYKNPLKPSIVDQYEVGFKKNIIRNTVSLNLSIYQIQNRNAYTTAIYDVNGNVNSDSTIKEFAGKILSRGVELDMTGNPNRFLTLIGGVSYNNSVYKDTPEKTGYVENQTLVKMPNLTANASVFYKIPQLKGFFIGSSLFYTGQRKAGWNDLKIQTQQTRIINLPDYTTVDFSLGYDSKLFSVQGKVGNVFNKSSLNVHENYSVNPTTPRNYYITLTYKL